MKILLAIFSIAISALLWYRSVRNSGGLRGEPVFGRNLTYKYPTPLKVFLLVLGGIFTAIGLRTVQICGETKHWPVANGVITASELIHHDNFDERNEKMSNIIYSYSVNGASYTCRDVFFGHAISFSDRIDYSELVNRYPVGAPVKVYYNPRKPNMALLEPGFGWRSSQPLVLGVLFLMMSVPALFKKS